MSDVCILSPPIGPTQSALPVGLLKSGTLLENTHGIYLCYEELEAWGEKTQNETYCAAGDGAKVELPAAVWAAGTLCSKGLFEQLITEGSQPA